MASLIVAYNGPACSVEVLANMLVSPNVLAKSMYDQYHSAWDLTMGQWPVLHRKFKAIASRCMARYGAATVGHSTL